MSFECQPGSYSPFPFLLGTSIMAVLHWPTFCSFMRQEGEGQQLKRDGSDTESFNSV